MALRHSRSSELTGIGSTRVAEIFAWFVSLKMEGS